MITMLSGPVAQAIGWALLHLVWQGVLVAAILAAALSLMQRQSASARYLVSCGAMIALLVLLVATAGRAYDPSTTSTPLPQAIVMHATTLLDANGTNAAPSTSIATSPTWSDYLARAIAFAAPHLPTIVLVWAIGVLLLSVRLLFGWVRALDLARRNAQPAGAEWQRAAKRLAHALRLHRGVELLESAAVEVPTVIGFLRPVILLPIATLSGLSTEQIEMILAHELAHIRRHDFFINLLQAVVETLLFYHPAVWWISRRVRIEREHCCDDMAVAVCGNALQYARALTRLEELRVDPAHAFIAANGGSLLTRIRRLIGERAESPNGPSRWAAGAALLTVLVALLAAPSLPLLADRQQADDQKPKAKTRSKTKSSTSESVRESQSEVTVRATTEPDERTDPEVDIEYAPTTPEPPSAPEPAVADAIADGVEGGVAGIAVPAPPATPAPVVTVRPARAAMPAVTPRPMVRINVAPIIAEVAPRAIASAMAAIANIDAMDHETKSRSINSTEKLDVDELIALRATGVTPEYIQQMRDAGLGDLTYRDVISMRANGVSPDYIRSMRDAGLEIKSAHTVVALRANGVTSEWIATMKHAGITKFTTNEVIALRANGVDGTYINAMNAAGYTNLTPHELIALRANGVGPEYIQALSNAGYKNVAAHDLIALRANGVSPSFIKTLSEAGYANLSVRDLIRMAANGVNADFIRDLQKYKKQ